MKLFADKGLLFFLLLFWTTVLGVQSVQAETIGESTVFENGWREIRPGGETVCARGGEYAFFVHPGTSKNVVVDFMGGGACWSEKTCHPDAGIFQDNVDYLSSAVRQGMNGIYDRDNLKNPFKDWTYILIPYCTGDIHWGNQDVTYGKRDKAFTIHHKGAVNAKAALSWVYQNLRSPQKIFVTGSSAGAYGSIYWTPHLKKHYPSSQIFQMGDCGAGVITKGFAKKVFPLWNVGENSPHWIPALNPASAKWSQLSLEDIYEGVGKFYPDLVLSQFNTSHDHAQMFYYRVMGGMRRSWPQHMKESMQELDQRLDNFHYFIAPGTQHMILGEDNFYSLTSNQHRFFDWMLGMIEEKKLMNVDCGECQ